MRRLLPKLTLLLAAAAGLHLVSGASGLEVPAPAQSAAAGSCARLRLGTSGWRCWGIRCSPPAPWTPRPRPSGSRSRAAPGAGCSRGPWTAPSPWTSSRPASTCPGSCPGVPWFSSTCCRCGTGPTGPGTAKRPWTGSPATTTPGKAADSCRGWNMACGSAWLPTVSRPWTCATCPGTGRPPGTPAAWPPCSGNSGTRPPASTGPGTGTATSPGCGSSGSWPAGAGGPGPDRFENLEILADTLSRRGITPVFVLTPWCEDLVHAYGGAQDREVLAAFERYRGRVAQYLADHGRACLDLHGQVPPDGFADCFHTNALGGWSHGQGAGGVPARDRRLSGGSGPAGRPRDKMKRGRRRPRSLD